MLDWPFSVSLLCPTPLHSWHGMVPRPWQTGQVSYQTAACLTGRLSSSLRDILPATGRTTLVVLPAYDGWTRVPGGACHRSEGTPVLQGRRGDWWICDRVRARLPRGHPVVGPGLRTIPSR